MRTGRLFSLLGGSVFLAIGGIKIASVFTPKFELLSSRRETKGTTCLALGIGVSVDCVPACAFFAVSPLTAALWACVIALMHATFFTCGALCFSSDKKSAMLDGLAGWTLVAVGLLKMARV
jgi:putative Mn2+ efflux pump MntP